MDTSLKKKRRRFSKIALEKNYRFLNKCSTDSNHVSGTLWLKLLMVWILTGLSGLVLALSSNWMGVSRFYACMVWSGLVSECKWFGLVWISMIHSLTRSSHKESDSKNKILNSQYKILSKGLKLVRYDSIYLAAPLCKAVWLELHVGPTSRVGL